MRARRASLLEELAQILFRAGSVERHDAKAIVTQPAYEGDVRWGGVDDRGFMSAALFTGPGARLAYKRRRCSTQTERRQATMSRTRPSRRRARCNPQVCMGPKQFDLLQGIDQQLVKAVDFGWFAFIATPLLDMLKGINGSSATGARRSSC